MAVMGKTKSVLTLSGRVINEVISFMIFFVFDILDFLLCFVYKLADFLIEAEWKPCYCSSGKEAITGSGKILVSEQGESKILCVSTSKLQLEEISDTLHTRPFLVSQVSNLIVTVLKRLMFLEKTLVQSCDQEIKKGSPPSVFRVNSPVIEILQRKLGRKQLHPIPRWSDCDCNVCISWTSSSKETLYVRAEGPKDNAQEDVLFIHGFISTSKFWTETLFPNFSSATKSTYRMFAIDLLGFGRSPKPTDCLYTLKDHLDMIERSVLEPNKVKSFHIVAHSLGCILALALTEKHPGCVKSLTLLAPPYYPMPKDIVNPSLYTMKKLAPRLVWPPIKLGAAMACYYEHISRTMCLVLCKNHRLWDFLTKLVTRNRIRTYLVEGFFVHTHNAAWHTLHNIICGTASKVEGYMDVVQDQIKCHVNIFHGEYDDTVPVECSYNVQKRIPRARVKVIKKKDHLTIVVGRQQGFASDLEEIWRNASRS